MTPTPTPTPTRILIDAIVTASNHDSGAGVLPNPGGFLACIAAGDGGDIAAAIRASTPGASWQIDTTADPDGGLALSVVLLADPGELPPRTWVCSDGNGMWTVEADDLDGAEDEVRDSAGDGLDADGEPTWYAVSVVGPLPDDVSQSEYEEWAATLDLDDLKDGQVDGVIDAVEPACMDDAKHDWSDDPALVGGNPGVWGHGGGVKISEGCTRCACWKTIDTWAQNPLDGTQGHTVVTYTRGYYSESDDE